MFVVSVLSLESFGMHGVGCLVVHLHARPADVVLQFPLVVLVPEIGGDAEAHVLVSLLIGCKKGHEVLEEALRHLLAEGRLLHDPSPYVLLECHGFSYLYSCRLDLETS